MKSVLGIIGGSGIYNFPALEETETLSIESPFGAPSAPLRRGRIGATEIVFLARHGRGHVLSPSDINYRANIDCLKRAGVTDLISLSACGSFRDELPPGHFVLIDQFIDRTYKRETSFFGHGCVAHVSMAEPVSPRLVARLADAALALQLPVQRGGIYVAIEGPHFSTKAESLAYKAMGASVIGMTAMPEAKLAREAEMSFALVAMVTDYDCWHSSHDQVDAAMVAERMTANFANAMRLIVKLAHEFPAEHDICPIGSDRALDHAIMTEKSARDPELMKKLNAVAGRILRA